MKIVRCSKCGNIAFLLKESGVPMMCCGERMKELDPLTRDGAVEKHVPIVVLDGRSVHVIVGSVLHPMVDVHYIQWIVVETTKGIHKYNLLPNEEPKVEVRLADNEEFVSAYEYCNLHGLWKNN